MRIWEEFVRGFGAEVIGVFVREIEGLWDRA